MKKLSVITLCLCMLTNMLSAYPFLSPYSYCAGNPINVIDPTGEDIVILNEDDGLHLAMLMQDEEQKWRYYSVNGDNLYSSGTHVGGRPFDDIAVGSWDSPEEFFNSSYNSEDGDGKKDAKVDKTINGYGFNEGFRISTEPWQDAVMREAFTRISTETEYDLVTNNCAHAVQLVMIEAGIPINTNTEAVYIPVSTPFGLVDVFSGYKLDSNPNIVPSIAFKSIMEANPTGSYLHK